MSTDTETYQLRTTAKAKKIDPATSPRALMADAIIAEGPAPDESERPAALPVIPPSVVEDNLRRVKAGAANTLVTILPDGKRIYRESRVVREGDGLISTVRDGGQRSDRGEGTTDSLAMLSKEGKVNVAGLLGKDGRDKRGRFAKS
jgi:hypothetical protein